MSAFILTCLMLLAPQQPSSASDPAGRDAQVVSAVLTQTIRREVDKLLARPDGWRGSPLVVLLDRTIPMCPDRTGPWTDCIETSSVPSWWTPAWSAAFTVRNAGSVPVPSVHVLNVQPAKYEATEGRRPFELYASAAGWVSVSQPAYAGTGSAVVYVYFACGAMCCRGWFILLEPTPTGWRVMREVGTVIC